MSLTEVLMRLGISVILAAIIGLEREIRKKPLGLKTSLVICLSSCLITIVSIESATKYAHQALTVMDPMRLAAQIVSGVGFIGAGVILRKNNDVILGLTTAALIWAAAGLGIAVGAGFYKEAILGTMFLIISVEIFPKVVNHLGPSTLREKEIKLTFAVQCDADVPAVIETIKTKEIKVGSVHIRDSKDMTALTLVIAVDAKRKTAEVYKDLKTLPNIFNIDIESL